MRGEHAEERVWAPQGEVDTRYARAGQLWDARIGSARRQALTWQRACLMQSLVSGLCVVGLIYQSSKAQVIPYLVEVQAEGEVRLVGAVTEQEWSLNESAKRVELERWIRNLRALSSDQQIVRERFAYVRAHATAAANLQLERYMEEVDPFSRFGKELRTAHILSITQLAGSSQAYRVEWREEVFGERGEALGEELWIGEFHLSIVPPTTAETLKVNPLGVHVSFFDIDQKRQ